MHDYDCRSWDPPGKSCDPSQYQGFYYEPLPKPRRRTLPEWHPDEDDIPVRTLRDPRHRTDAQPSLQDRLQERRDKRAALTENRRDDQAGDAPLTDEEKANGGGCLMALFAIAFALSAYVFDTSISVALPVVKIEKRVSPKPPPPTHATPPKK